MYICIVSVKWFVLTDIMNSPRNTLLCILCTVLVPRSFELLSCYILKYNAYIHIYVCMYCFLQDDLFRQRLLITFFIRRGRRFRIRFKIWFVSFSNIISRVTKVWYSIGAYLPVVSNNIKNLSTNSRNWTKTTWSPQKRSCTKTSF